MTKKVFESIAETWNEQHPDDLKLNPKLKPNYSVIIMPNVVKGRQKIMEIKTNYVSKFFFFQK